ncbi:Cof subfamily of IIB subfamily of haloacid dehalogenase superfamily/HAD-superfamily hydrolase, subfamily IIB [Pilibacter termitis]|uniref:Cof subfamily of IIB subfamily of haloacid dehalogenase superfamily/HAD-superfamily hydrolase, subfamily IIB n=1 Tax=Pilibacter termitis TaxID=263852 RepID=A0A1T4P507_9ENTE|nr:Cof-type HAD-IIB family hydrolase [Pilibacter termitis]SJZ86481.1 Cof subfamily of IIB subfamily of haloacid dehalogenase superfamily/HAD-superfamily hydrolase, subfamily IIB [Pilibacter termitis]
MLTRSREDLREHAKKIKAIFFDIDDTLRLKDEEFMPESVKDVFRRLKEKGILTGIASGRAYHAIVPEVRELGADVYVTINGQYVITPSGEELYSNPIPSDVVERAIEWAKSENVELVFIGSSNVALTKWNEYGEAALPIVYGRGIIEYPKFHEKHRVYQMLTINENAESLVLPEELRQHVRLVKWHPYSNDIIPLGGSKANGIARVIESLGLTPDEIMAFGDEMNDIEMFNFVGIAVAMGNANWKVKPLADYVTKTVTDDGILDALETLGILDKTED